MRDEQIISALRMQVEAAIPDGWETWPVIARTEWHQQKTSDAPETHGSITVHHDGGQVAVIVEESIQPDHWLDPMTGEIELAAHEFSTVSARVLPQVEMYLDYVCTDVYGVAQYENSHTRWSSLHRFGSITDGEKWEREMRAHVPSFVSVEWLEWWETRVADLIMANPTAVHDHILYRSSGRRRGGGPLQSL